ncbi:hypothetical protein KCU85_g227, partial [Aureobasidium melanogenum]
LGKSHALKLIVATKMHTFEFDHSPKPSIFVVCDHGLSSVSFLTVAAKHPVQSSLGQALTTFSIVSLCTSSGFAPTLSSNVAKCITAVKVRFSALMPPWNSKLSCVEDMFVSVVPMSWRRLASSGCLIHERTIVVDAHAVAEGLLWQVISCMLYGDVHDRAAGQWHVLDSKRFRCLCDNGDECKNVA